MSSTVLSALGDYSAMTLTMAGTPDWDTYIFDMVDAGTFTNAQAQWLWDYSDGWTAKLDATSTSATPAASHYCLKKSAGYDADNGLASMGLFCFSIGG
jgi:hypothetical protein